jgi:hypothetical protein
VALIFTASAACLWLAATRLFPVLGNPLPACGGLVLAGLVVCALITYRRRPSLADAALAADQRLGLKERLISSHQLAAAPGPMVAALHKDAATRLVGLNWSTAFPLPVTRAMKAAAIPVLVFGIIYLALPEWDLLHHKEKVAKEQARKREVAARVDKLKATARTLQGPEEKTSPDAAKAASAIERVAEDLKSGAITDKQAIARLSDLSKELESVTEKMKEDNQLPTLGGDKALGKGGDSAAATEKDGLSSKLGITKDAAKDIEKGDLKSAAKKLQALKDKLAKGELSEKEKESLQKDAEELSKALGEQGSALGDALSKELGDLSKDLSKGDLQNAKKDLDNAGANLDDMASALEQLEKMNAAQKDLKDMKDQMAGSMPAPDGKESDKEGMGMKGPGRGKGNTVGKLPEDEDLGYKPTVLPGPMTRGKALMSILQKGSPDVGAEPKLEYVEGAYIEVEKEAEEGLSKEEIPAGSKEFVRQYFGELKPEKKGEEPSH